jgi:hypothetical protein
VTEQEQAAETAREIAGCLHAFALIEIIYADAPDCRDAAAENIITMVTD